MQTKSQLMARVASGELAECFTHESLGSFVIEPTRLLAETFGEKIIFDCLQADIDLLFSNRDIDPDRVAMLSREQCLERILLLACEDGTHLLIDGTHRMVAGFTRFGMRTFRGLFLDVALATRPSTTIRESPSNQWGAFSMVDGKPVPNSGV